LLYELILSCRLDVTFRCF